MSIINTSALTTKASDRRDFSIGEIASIAAHLGENLSGEQMAAVVSEEAGTAVRSKLSMGAKVRSIKNWVREVQNTPEFTKANEAGDADAIAKLYHASHRRRGSKA